MAVEKIFKGDTEEEIWQQLTTDFNKETNLLEYTAVIIQQAHRIVLNIDIDPGGGFESGYETTSLISNLDTNDDFRFAIHHEGFLDEIGKFFGMQDVVIGYPEFDKKVIVKTNDETRIKSLFTKDEVRNIFQSLHNYTFGTTKHNDVKALELTIESAITDATELREIYRVFIFILTVLTEK